MPAGVLDQCAADDRSEDGAEEHRDSEHCHHRTDPSRACRLGQNHHSDRHQHAAAETLQHPEDDQGADTPGQRTQHRAQDEQHQRRQIDLLGAETCGGPARQRDDRGQGQRVTGHRPRRTGLVGAELILECVLRHGHNRGVENRHDRAEHDHGSDLDHCRIELVARTRRC